MFAPVRAFGPPALHGVGPMPFPALQSAFDALYPPGHQWYWRADFVNELSDAAIAQHVAARRALPTLQSTMHLYPIDGAAHDVGPQRHRVQLPRRRTGREVIVGVDPDPANTRRRSPTGRKRYYDALHPHSAPAAPM